MPRLRLRGAAPQLLHTLLAWCLARHWGRHYFPLRTDICPFVCLFPSSNPSLLILVCYACLVRSRGSSVSIVSGYGLDDRAIEVRSPAGAKDFSFSLCVQTGSGPPPQPPIQWVTGVLSPGVKRGRGVTLTTNSHLMPRSRMSRCYTSSPPKRLHGV
jgi:hypothetical protein